MWLSFTSGVPGDPQLTYTLRNYADVFLDTFTYRVLWNTLLFLAVTLIVAFSLGLPIAWLVERTDFPGKTAVFTLMTVALLIPGFAVALGWVFLLHPSIGVVNQALVALFGLDAAPFNIAQHPRHGNGRGLQPHPAHLHHDRGRAALDGSGAGGGRGDERREAVAGHRSRSPCACCCPGILAAAIYVSAVGFAAFDVPAILGMTNRIYTFSTYVFRQLTPTEGLPEYGNVATLGVVMVVVARC